MATAEDFNFGDPNKQNSTEVPRPEQQTTEHSIGMEYLSGDDSFTDTSASKSPKHCARTVKFAHDLCRGGMTADDLRQAKAQDRIITVTETHTAPAKPFVHHDPTGSVHISKPDSQSKPAVTPILPTTTNSPEAISTTFYTYRAQLTFGLPPSTDGVNIAKYFCRWVYSLCASIDHFSLIPYDDDKGQQITSLDQVPEENTDFYAAYYHNHRILNHGNVTGMVAFQCSTPWANWLQMNKVFLNQTKFKTSSLIPCGFLLGAHPGHLRRDDAEKVLCISLGFQPEEELPFQLSSRTVSVPTQEGQPDRYAFHAVVVETFTSQAASLRKKFYGIGTPAQAQEHYPYTGRYQFVPFLKTKEWTIPKIYNLAKLHVKIVQDLKAIFIIHLQDIHNSIN